MDALIIVVGVGVVIGVVLFTVFWALGRITRKRAAIIAERFPNTKLIVPMANFFGQESKGVTQLRGNGIMVITSSEVYFQQLVTNREWHIALGSIQMVETTKSHLGKSIGRPLLKIRYINPEGRVDTVAWWVKNLDEVLQTIESLRQPSTPPPSMSKQSEAAARERFPDAKMILSDANLFGQESKGVGQIGGTGLLLVTASEVYFERYLPKAEFHIPLHSIQSIETPDKYMGKSIGSPLIKLNFTNEQGQADSIGWWVADVESLKTLLESTQS
ncbi:MAG: hypothetical protein DPW16_09320 [Chloroflexi bacterium]|nr:hypothetical protein [Chloroflexota bacterium]